MKFTIVAAMTLAIVAVARVHSSPVPAAVALPLAPGPIKKVDEQQVTFHIAGDTPAEVQESVRRARQIIDEINIDIIQNGGGGYGGYNGFNNGYNGYNNGYNGFNNGYNGYNNGDNGFNNGYGGGYGGGYEEDINISIDNFGK